MTETQKRELDQWIDVNLFDGGKFVGLKKRGLWYRPEARGYTEIQDHAGRFPIEEARKHAMPNVEDAVTIHKFSPKKYTTDPAAAMEVFKKCLEQAINIETWQTVDGNGGKSFWFSMPNRAFFGEADTLELAIALFAQKLFSK